MCEKEIVCVCARVSVEPNDASVSTKSDYSQLLALKDQVVKSHRKVTQRRADKISNGFIVSEDDLVCSLGVPDSRLVTRQVTDNGQTMC